MWLQRQSKPLHRAASPSASPGNLFCLAFVESFYHNIFEFHVFNMTKLGENWAVFEWGQSRISCHLQPYVDLYQPQWWQPCPTRTFIHYKWNSLHIVHSQCEQHIYFLDPESLSILQSQISAHKLGNCICEHVSEEHQQETPLERRNQTANRTVVLLLLTKPVTINTILLDGALVLK